MVDSENIPGVEATCTCCKAHSEPEPVPAWYTCHKCLKPVCLSCTGHCADDSTLLMSEVGP